MASWSWCRCRRRLVPAFVCVVSVVTVASPAAAEAPNVDAVEPASSSKRVRQEAVEALALESLSPQIAAEVRRCVEGTSIYRRLPEQEFACHPAILDFALEHPEGIVDIWRVLEISLLELDAAGPQQWRLADGYGTVGTLRVAGRRRHADGGTLLLFGRGAYTGMLTAKPLTGSCVVLLRYSRTPSSTARVRLRCDAFLDVDGFGLELVTRTLKPLIVSTAAWNMHEVCLFMAGLSQAAERNPEGIATLADRLTRIEPACRQRLAAAARDAAGSRQRTAAADDAEATRVELASRWMTTEQLENAARRVE
jgi:hypothetical protein